LFSRSCDHIVDVFDANGEFLLSLNEKIFSCHPSGVVCEVSCAYVSQDGSLTFILYDVPSIWRFDASTDVLTKSDLSPPGYYSSIFAINGGIWVAGKKLDQALNPTNGTSEVMVIKGLDRGCRDQLNGNERRYIRGIGENKILVSFRDRSFLLSLELRA
jgi:hypothetical protein